MTKRSKKKRKTPGTGSLSPPAEAGAFRQRFPGWRHILTAVVLIVAAAGAIHGPEIRKTHHMHFWETVQYMQHVDMYVHSAASSFAVPPLWPGLYRPVSTNLYYYLGIQWFDHKVEPLKVFNLFVFVANGILLCLILAEILPFWWSLVTVLLWVSRRAHAEIVTVTVEAQSLLSVFFMLTCIYAYIRARASGRLVWDIVSYASFALALLSKETAVVTPAVLLAWWWLFDRRREWRPLAIHVVIALSWALFFVTYARGMRDHMGTGFLYTASPLRILSNYVAHVVDFSNLIVGDGSEPNMEVHQGIIRLYRPVISSVALVAAIAGAGVVAFRKKTSVELRLLIFGIAFFILSMSPYVITINRLVLRYSYVGHIGVAICVTVLAKMLWDGAAPSVRRFLARKRAAA